MAVYGFQSKRVAETLRRVALERMTQPQQSLDVEYPGVINPALRGYVVIPKDVITAATHSSGEVTLGYGQAYLYRRDESTDKLTQQLDDNSNEVEVTVYNAYPIAYPTPQSGDEDTPVFVTQDMWGDLYIVQPDAVQPFELKDSLAPGSYADAYPTTWDGAKYVADTGTTIVVYDTFKRHRGRARNASTCNGSHGIARWHPISGQLEITYMEPFVTLAKAKVNESNGVQPGDSNFNIDNVTAIQPNDQAIWLTTDGGGNPTGAAPTSCDNTGGFFLEDNEDILIYWDDAAEAFEVLGPVGPCGIRWGKVQSGFSNASMAAKQTVSVKTCDIDGNNVTGNVFDVYTPAWGSQHATSLFMDDIVGFVTDKAGNLVIVTPCSDDAMNVIKAWGGTADSLPPGWSEWSGSPGRVLAGYTGSGDYATIGAIGGTTQHTHTGHSEHTLLDHDDHYAHCHGSEGAVCVDVNLDGAVDDVWDYMMGVTGSDGPYSHSAHMASGSPGLGHDNNHSYSDHIDPFKVVQWMIRSS